MIRELTKYDEILSAAIVMKGFESSSQHVTVDPRHSADTYKRMVDSGAAVFFVLEQDGAIIGGLGGIKYPDLHNGRLTAVETFWFVQPEHRGKGLSLFDAFEQWGKDAGCSALAMIHMVDSYPCKLETLYRRRGYVLVEKHYVKELK